MKGLGRCKHQALGGRVPVAAVDHRGRRKPSSDAVEAKMSVPKEVALRTGVSPIVEGLDDRHALRVGEVDQGWRDQREVVVQVDDVGAITPQELAQLAQGRSWPELCGHRPHAAGSRAGELVAAADVRADHDAALAQHLQLEIHDPVLPRRHGGSITIVDDQNAHLPPP